MKSYETLPNGYREKMSVNLRKEKKRMLIVNFSAIIVAFIIAILMHFVVPVSSLFDFSKGISVFFIKYIVLIIGNILYFFLHEFLHGVAMKLCGTKKVKYGFKGVYAFAGSDDYYDKKSYLMIAMAPVVVLGIILIILNCIVPSQWFWVVFLIQISNISGAMGDIYIAICFRKLPKDALLRDDEIGIIVYSAE